MYKMKHKVLRTTDSGLLKFKDITAVTSKTVADALGVRHVDLMRNVKKAEKYLKSHYAELHSENLHFNPVFDDYKYTNERGRTYDCKIMNRDGVKVLIKVVDTQEAFNYFMELMNDFSKMELEREVRKELITPTKQLNKLIVKVLQPMLLQELPNSSKSSRLLIHIRNAINGAVTGKNKKVDRDTLTLHQDEEMDYLERVIGNRIIYMLDAGDTAEDIRTNTLELLKKLKKIL